MTIQPRTRIQLAILAASQLILFISSQIYDYLEEKPRTRKHVLNELRRGPRQDGRLEIIHEDAATSPVEGVWCLQRYLWSLGHELPPFTPAWATPCRREF